MWFAFPTPFKRGDIVVSEYGPFGRRRGGEVFVLHSIDSWTEKERRENGIAEEFIKDRDKLLAVHKANGDITDMVASGYFLNDDGSIYYEVMHSYHELQYYRGELKNEKRTLAALSSYLKGELDIDTLLNAYHIFLQQKNTADGIKFLGVRDETLKKLGLK